jgi:hypothetical protein
VTAMRAAGISEADIETVVWHNPISFFGQSGRLDLSAHGVRPRIDQRQQFEGNSVLRGQQPLVDPAP